MNVLRLFNPVILAQAPPPEEIPPTDTWTVLTSLWEWWAALGVFALVIVGLFAFSYLTRAGIIARATMKEAIRQPVFLLLMALAILVIVVNTYVPFFSLGEDVKMLKDCSLATILICGLLMAVWTSSTSVADEIEGKTAMTLLSKPINRRQFIAGKFVGILQSVLLMLVPVIAAFLAAILYKVGYDAKESSEEIPALALRIPSMVQVIPGIVLILLEIAILTAISVAISTRMPMIVNMTTCLAIFVIGHLTPVLLQASVTNVEFVLFVARLIATILPSLDVFNTQSTVATGTIVPPDYLGYSALYCASYCGAALLLAFILFEDRDLA